MASKEAKKFYSSKKWQKCREEYARSVGYLCENCLKKGIYNPGEIVHHKIHISDVNLYNPEITLNKDNLILLCRDCHGEQHKRKKKRYAIGRDGRISPLIAEK